MKLTREDLHRIIEEELDAVLSEKKNPRIPRKKGQPAKSDKHSDLYTDEDPKGTIHGLKFATVADAERSVAKIKKSGRSHAHKVQAAVAMEQRAKAAGKKSAAAVYRKYINSVKKEEVYSDKQRRYMCAMAEPDADRPEGLSQAEAEEMCKGPMKKEAKAFHWDEPDWEYGGGYGDGTLEEKKKKKRKKAGTESSKESSLRDWFKRKGAKGKKGGWVDCNAPDGKGGYKSCGRADGEKRKKYPSCKERGRGKSWGKKSAKGKKG